MFNLEIGHRGSCWPRQHLTRSQIWKFGVNVKRQRTPSDVNCSTLSIMALTWSDEDMCLVRVDVLKFVQPVVKGFFVLVLIQKEQVICCLLASYCSHFLYQLTTAVETCVEQVAGTPADPDDSFFF